MFAEGFFKKQEDFFFLGARGKGLSRREKIKDFRVVAEVKADLACCWRPP